MFGGGVGVLGLPKGFERGHRLLGRVHQAHPQEARDFVANPVIGGGAQPARGNQEAGKGVQSIQKSGQFTRGIPQGVHPFHRHPHPQEPVGEPGRVAVDHPPGEEFFAERKNPTRGRPLHQASWLRLSLRVTISNPSS